ncbi:MAG: glycosyltransferase family 2 protein [Planctomycetota bacterium]
MGDSFAVAYSSKNEADLLPDGIAFHQRMGCDKVYMFWDETSDDGPDRVARFSDIDARVSLSASEAMDDYAEHGGGWIPTIIHDWERNFDIRKRINFTHAADQAAKEGIEWLLCLDADELAIPSADGTLGTGALQDMLREVPDEIDQVLMPNLEAIPTPPDDRSPFRSCRHFLRRVPVTHDLARAAGVVGRRLGLNPRQRAWLSHWVYRLRFGGRFPKPMIHPVTGQAIPRGHFLGYTNFKSMIRTSRASRFRHDVHQWDAPKGVPPPRSIKTGNLLHFAYPSADLLMRKYRQRGPGFTKFEAFHVVHQILLIATELDDETVRSFFGSEFVIDDESLLAKYVRQGIAHRIDGPAEAFEAMDNALRV